jgi:alpha 1,2-mannosyltransferase
MQRPTRLAITVLVSLFVLWKLMSFGKGGAAETAKETVKAGYESAVKLKESVGGGQAAEYISNLSEGAKYAMNTPRANATFVTLARNSDLHEIVKSIRNVEDRFNHNFNYPWVFLNDVPFDDEFKRVTSAMCSGKVEYGVIPEGHWGMPAHIDKNRAAEVRKQMGKDKIIYGDSESYRYMCRYESGFFYRHPLMMKYEYYWRVEPSIEMYCDVDYDPFVFMKENNKVYGFTISLYEYETTIKTLWEETKKFIKKRPELLPKNNLMEFISEDNGETYNKCHFWSNFEIAKLDFWRKGAYAEYFDHLDQAGGFFYERWGDAPVHSIGAALFAEKDQVHWFSDMGYYHVPFTHCPVDPKMREKCHCDVNESFDWKGWSCTPRFHDVMKLERPANWKDYSK